MRFTNATKQRFTNATKQRFTKAITKQRLTNAITKQRLTNATKQRLTNAITKQRFANAITKQRFVKAIIMVILLHTLVDAVPTTNQSGSNQDMAKCQVTTSKIGLLLCLQHKWVRAFREMQLFLCESFPALTYHLSQVQASQPGHLSQVQASQPPHSIVCFYPLALPLTIDYVPPTPRVIVCRASTWNAIPGK